MTINVQPNGLAAWHALISEAQHRNNTFLNESLESYLVYLLLRFTQNTTWLDSAIAIDFLEAHHKPSAQQIQALKEVGDKCLLLSGLFPNHANLRKLNDSYFKDVGQTAYTQAHHLEIDRRFQSHSVYKELAHSFPGLVQILKTSRELQTHRLEKLTSHTSERRHPSFLDLSISSNIH